MNQVGGRQPQRSRRRSADVRPEPQPNDLCPSLHPDTGDPCDLPAGHHHQHRHIAWRVDAATGEILVAYQETWSSETPEHDDPNRLIIQHPAPEQACRWTPARLRSRLRRRHRCAHTVFHPLDFGHRGHPA